MNEISVEDVKRRHDGGEDIVLLDVREDDELRTVAIPWALHIPMGEVAERVHDLPRDRTLAVMCHHGGRSARVTMFLTQHGFDNVANLTGGIDAWAERIDPTLARY